MNCTEAGYLEPLYRAGDLDSRTMADIDLHLSMCQTCAQRWRQQDRLDGVLREVLVSEELDVSRVLARARNQMQAAPRTSWRLRLAALAATASLVAALVVFTALPSRVQPPALYADAAEDHADEVIFHQPREWVRGDAAVEQMVQSRLGTGVLMASLAPAGYHLDRGKICGLLNQPYLHLVYSNGSREVSFFVRARGNEQVPGNIVGRVNGVPVRAGRAKGLDVAGFQSSLLTILVVSPGPDAVEFATQAAGRV